MLTLRQRAIIDILSSEVHALTGRQLAQMLGVSDRTIRSDIDDLNREFGCEVIKASHRNGYRVDMAVLKQYQASNQDAIPQTSQQRCIYLIKELLFHRQEINLIELKNQVFVSEYSIDNDIRKIRTMIRDYPSLRLVRSKNHLRLQGDESEKRRLYKKLLTQETEGNFINLSAIAGIWKEFDLLELKDDLEEICQKYEYHISDLAYPVIMLHAGVSIERILQHNFVEEPSVDKQLHQQTEYKIANELFQRIEKRYNIDRVEDEVSRFAELLMKKNVIYDNRIDENLDHLIELILQNIQTRFEIDLSGDEEFISGIMSHIRLLIKRLHQQVESTNFYLPEIKWKYPLIFEMAVGVAGCIEAYYDCKLNENEICYLALHLGVAYERSSAVAHYRAVLIAPNSYVMMTRQCMNSLVQRFGNRMEIISRYNLFDERKMVQDNPDLILTTAPLKHNLNIPTIQISLFVSPEDESRVFQMLNRMDKQRYHQEFLKQVQDMMRPELFDIKQSMNSREEIIDFLCGKLQTIGLDDGNLKKYVMHRESYSSTSFVYGFAIPHTMGEFVPKTSISILLLREPVKWGGFDVRLVVLLAIREEDNNVLKVFLDWLFHIVTDRVKFEELIRANSFEEFSEHVVNAGEQ